MFANRNAVEYLRKEHINRKVLSSDCINDPHDIINEDRSYLFTVNRATVGFLHQLYRDQPVHRVLGSYSNAINDRHFSIIMGRLSTFRPLLSKYAYDVVS